MERPPPLRLDSPRRRSGRKTSRGGKRKDSGRKRKSEKRASTRRGGAVINFRTIAREEYGGVSSPRHRPASREVKRVGGDSVEGGPPRRKKRAHVKDCSCAACKRARARAGPKQLLFRMNSSSSKLIRGTFEAHGFRQTRGEQWLAMWTSSHLKSYHFQCLERHQKINQFPRSYEATRKDSLARNLARMQALHGERAFDFLPQSFVLPREEDAFCAAFEADGGATTWIVKPTASSQGRGIFLSQDLDEICDRGRERGENRLVSRYIDNPLLIDGLKFDLRIYVAVTSFAPLSIFLHEAGLARFATEPYDASELGNRFVHLTNYSINKKSDKYVAGSDGAEDEGNKWTLRALRRKLRESGVDDESLWESIRDLAIKTIISVESQVTAAIDMFVPHRGNCYQLFGFDVMIDADLKPWLLEVNFAPSLTCDSPLDLAVKSATISDLFNMVAFRLPAGYELRGAAAELASSDDLPPPRSWRPTRGSPRAAKLSAAECRAISRARAEDARCGGWQRIYPTHTAYLYHDLFEEERPLNTLMEDLYFTLSPRAALLTAEPDLTVLAALRSDGRRAVQHRMHRARTAAAAKRTAAVKAKPRGSKAAKGIGRRRSSSGPAVRQPAVEEEKVDDAEEEEEDEEEDEYEEEGEERESKESADE